MDEAIRTGIVLGLTLAVLIGPVFFALLQTSLEKGFVAAAFLALGIALSDATYIFITNLFLGYLKDNDQVEFFLGIFGGILLVVIGAQTFLKKPKATKNEIRPSRYQNAGLLLRGYALNFAHPGVLLFWIGVITLINTQWKYEMDEKWLLFSTTVGTVFITDLLKAFTAHKIKNFLTYNFLLWMNRIMGIVLVGFGLHLFLDTLLS